MPTLDLNEAEADAVRSALATYTNRMEQANSKYPHDHYVEQAELCYAVVGKLNQAEGRE